MRRRLLESRARSQKVPGGCGAGAGEAKSSLLLGIPPKFPLVFNNIEMNYIINNLICIFQKIAQYNIIYFVEVFF